MNITNINIFAEGYYSGQTYEENIAIRTETYSKLGNEIDEIVCYIGELDGKHSEVEAETTIDCYTENQIKNMDWEADNDGKQLYHKLEKIFKNHGLNLDEEIKIVEDYLNSLDTYIDVTVRVKKSNADKVIKYCNNL